MTWLRRLAVASFFLCLGIALIATAAWWSLARDPVGTLQRHHAALVRVERTPAPELGPRIERWRMITTRGDTVSALWCSASPRIHRPWTVVLLGGLVSGERAALLLPDGIRSNVLAVDWPWNESRHLTGWEIAARLRVIRTALLRSPGVLAIGVEAAARSRGVDARRIALIGVSLGVPPAVAALRLTHRPAALVLMHGAADLRELLRHSLVREGVPEPLAGVLATVAARMIHPLEPSLHGEAAAGRPVLIINARNDPRLPHACIERLHRTFPGADVRWRGSLHGARDRLMVIAAAAVEVQAWLEAQP